MLRRIGIVLLYVLVFGYYFVGWPLLVWWLLTHGWNPA